MTRITLENVSLDFPVLDDKARSLRHALLLNPIMDAGARMRQTAVGGAVTQNNQGRLVVRALDGVSFSLQEGDRVGLVGHNGSGKTTMLRVLSGIFEPTSGRVTIVGNAMPLLNITEGMSPDTTGLELIRLRGRLMGMSRARIEALVEDTIDFCELGEFINFPLRTYSAGMSVRLAFAIATAVPADILLMDEIIGAGDAAFLEKANARLKTFVGQAGILVVASHSPSIIQEWCSRAILFEHGRMLTFDSVPAVLERYEKITNAAAAA